VFVSYCATCSVGLNLVHAASDAVPLTEVTVRCTTEMICMLMRDRYMIRLLLSSWQFCRCGFLCSKARCQFKKNVIETRLNMVGGLPRQRARKTREPRKVEFGPLRTSIQPPSLTLLYSIHLHNYLIYLTAQYNHGTRPQTPVSTFEPTLNQVLLHYRRHQLSFISLRRHRRRICAATKAHCTRSCTVTPHQRRHARS
jgi:hypothetical protein